VVGIPARSTGPCRRSAWQGTLELDDGGSGAWNRCTGGRRYIFEAGGEWGAEECVAEMEAFKTRADALDLRHRRRLAAGRSAAASLVC